MNSLQLETIFHYYRIAWVEFPDVEKLCELFQEDLEFHYTAQDDPSRIFDFNTSKDTIEGFYKMWAKIADGKNTRITNLSICWDGNKEVALVKYDIVQKQLTTTMTSTSNDEKNTSEWKEFFYQAEETFTLNPTTNKISRIQFKRLCKMPF